MSPGNCPQEGWVARSERGGRYTASRVIGGGTCFHTCLQLSVDNKEKRYKIGNLGWNSSSLEGMRGIRYLNNGETLGFKVCSHETIVTLHSLPG